MPRDPSGLYSRPSGTTAVSGALITDEIFNDTQDDVAAALSDSATRAQLLDVAGSVTSTGTGAAYSVTTNASMTTLAAGTLVGFRPHVANTGPAVLTVTSAGTAFSAAPLRAITGVDLATGDLSANSPILASYSPTSFSKAITGTLTAGSTQITGVSDTIGIAAGQAVSAPVSGLPVGTTVSSVSGTTVTLSAAFAGTTTSGATIAITGAEWLLLQGSLLATALRLSRAGGVAPVLVSSNAALDAGFKSKYIQATGTVALTLGAATALGSAWFAYLTNIGAGDVTLQVPSATAFTASATQGSAAIASISNTNGVAIGQRVSVSIPNVTITGTLTTSSPAITAPSSTTSTFVGQTVSAAGLPAGTAITGYVPSTVTFTASPQNSFLDMSAVSSFTGLVVGAVITGTGIAPGTTILGFYTGSAGGAATGNFIRLSQPATGTATNTTITQPQQIVLSAAYTGTTSAGATIIASGGKPLPDGTTITGLAGTAATLSAAWAGPTTIGASFTAYTDNVDGLTGYIVYPGETRLLVCDGVSTTASRVLTPFQFTATTSRFFTMPPGYGGVGLDGVGASGGGGGGGTTSPGTGGGGGGRLPPMRVSGITPSTVIPILVGAAGAGGAGGAPGSSGGNTSFGSYLAFGGGGPGLAGTAGGLFGGAGGGTGAVAAFTAGASATGGAGGIAASGNGMGAEWGGGAGGGSSGIGGNSIYSGAGGGSGGPGTATTGGYPGGISGPAHAPAVGGFSGSSGGNGANARSDVSAGDGGGGGGGNGSGVGGAGGAGGYPGGGGGGGGPGSAGGGTGGPGAAGLLKVWGI